MKSKRLTRFVFAAVAVTVAIFGRGITIAQEAKLKTLKLGGGSFTTSVAQANGIFAKYGLQIEIPRSASGGSDEVRKWLASGELDLADYGVDNAIAIVENAGVDAILVAATDYTPTELIGKFTVRENGVVLGGMEPSKRTFPSRTMSTTEAALFTQIGRASCRERVYVLV